MPRLYLQPDDRLDLSGVRSTLLKEWLYDRIDCLGYLCATSEAKWLKRETGDQEACLSPERADIVHCRVSGVERRHDSANVEQIPLQTYQRTPEYAELHMGQQ